MNRTDDLPTPDLGGSWPAADGGGVIVVGTTETLPGAVSVAMGSAPTRPRLLGSVVVRTGPPDPSGCPPWIGGLVVLGTERDLHRVVSASAPSLALVCLPAAMAGVVARIETTLEALGVAVRRFPTVEDALLGGATLAGEIEPDLQSLVGREARPIDTEIACGAIRDKRVLITGAGGSIGSELAKMCAGLDPAELVLMDRSENALFEIDRWLNERAPGVPRRAMLHDVVHEDATAACVADARPQTVFHAAAHKHVPLMQDHPGEALRNNLFGTKSVADAAAACGTERFVLVSTDKAVRPRSVMGATKRLAERYVRSLSQRGLRCGVVRFGNVLGSASSVLPIWRSQLAEGGPLTITDARMTRYFMTIPEAAALVVEASGLVGRSQGIGAVFVLDMGEPVGIVDLAMRFARSMGLTAVLPGNDASPSDGVRRGTESGPLVRIRITGARPGEKLHEELAHDPAALRPTEVAGVQRFDAEPVSLGEGEAMAERLRPWCGRAEKGAVIAAIAQEVPDFARPETERLLSCPPERVRAA